MGFCARISQWWAVFNNTPVVQSDNRHLAVRRVLVQELLCRHKGRDFKAQMLDLSAQGMKLVCAHGLKAEDTLEINSPDQRQHILGRVAWVKNDRHGQWTVGVQFNPSDENNLDEWLNLAAISQPA